MYGKTCRDWKCWCVWSRGGVRRSQCGDKRSSLWHSEERMSFLSIVRRINSKHSNRINCLMLKLAPEYDFKDYHTPENPGDKSLKLEDRGRSVWSAHGGWKREWDPLELEFQMVVSCQVVVGDWTSALWKSSQCSYPLSHLSSPFFFFSFLKLGGGIRECVCVSVCVCHTLYGNHWVVFRSPFSPAS